MAWVRFRRTHTMALQCSAVQGSAMPSWRRCNGRLHGFSVGDELQAWSGGCLTCMHEAEWPAGRRRDAGEAEGGRWEALEESGGGGSRMQPGH